MEEGKGAAVLGKCGADEEEEKGVWKVCREFNEATEGPAKVLCPFRGWAEEEDLLTVNNE